jgi:hypothetical protein
VDRRQFGNNAAGTRSELGEVHENGVSGNFTELSDHFREADFSLLTLIDSADDIFV